MLGARSYGLVSSGRPYGGVGARPIGPFTKALPTADYHQRRRSDRRFSSGRSLHSISAADIIEMQNRAREVTKSRFDVDKLQDLIPLLAFLIWQVVGTVYYAVHDKFGWVRYVILISALE
jgi:hypothetical protein